MKEMPGAGKDRDRQLLRSRPVHDRRQGHGVIALAVYHQTVLMHFKGQWAGGEMADRRAHQYDFCNLPVGHKD